MDTIKTSGIIKSELYIRVQTSIFYQKEIKNKIEKLRLDEKINKDDCSGRDDNSNNSL